MMWRRKRAADDFATEIQAHLDLEADRLVADGMTPEAARLAARKAFGSVAAARERYHESSRARWLDQLGQDVRVAARSITRYPVAALVAVASLAFGIGAMTTTLMVRDVIFRKPPRLYQRPAALSLLLVTRPDRPGGSYPFEATVPGTVYRAWRETPPRGTVIAAATPGRIREVRIGDRTENIRVRAASPDLFSVLGVGPAAGRTFSDPPARPGATKPAVLSRRIWFAVFQDSPDAIGSTIWIDGEPHTIVGVMPADFWFAEMNAAIWVPFDAARLTRDDLVLAIGRRPADVSPASLAAALQPALEADDAARLPAGERQRRVVVRAVAGTPLGASMALLLPYVLGASVVLTLVIACANVAILMIAQWTAREHEIAIRASLGAGRGRIVRALVTEAVLLAAAGGTLGIAATFALRGILVRRAGVSLSLFDLSIDPSLYLQSALITLAAGIAAGLLPALHETRRLHANPLNALAASDRVRQRWRHALVVVEITVTIALLVETGGMINGYQRSIDADLGFDRRPLVAAQVENTRRLHVAAMLDVVTRMPGVSAAAAATGVPFMGSGVRRRFSGGAAADVAADQIAATPGLFATLGVPLVAGRDFTPADSARSGVAIVNEALARMLFPQGNAVGSHVRLEAGGDAAIVGIAADYATHQFQPRHAAPRLYVPLALDDSDARRVQVVIRGGGDPALLVPALRGEIRRSLPGTVVGSAFTYDEIVRIGAQEILVGTAPLVPLVAIGMLLTTAGIYGVLAFAIARRSRELAVRVAVGATARDLVRLVSAHSLRLVGLGTTLGVGVTFALSRVVRASGGGGGVYDPDWPSFVVPIAIVAAIGAAATWIPSRRALRINPAVVLRDS
jgi:putative ABC transport system permease protein